MNVDRSSWKADVLAEMHAALGHTPLNRAWAKIEIVLGLAAAGAGLLLGDWAVSRNAVAENAAYAGAGLLLFVFGGYLAMAGHRSHLYQSNNGLTAYLVRQIEKAQINRSAHA